MCCEATAVLPQTHRLCQVVEVVEEGGGWKHQSLVTQKVGVGCMQERERGRTKRQLLCATFHTTVISA